MSSCKHVRPTTAEKYRAYPWCVDEYDSDGEYVCTRYYNELEKAQEDAGDKKKGGKKKDGE